MPARNPFVLAALASVAVPGLEPVAARALPGQGDGEVDVAEVRDDAERSWVVRAPRTPAAAAALEQEWRFLGALTGRLPFAVPLLSGTAQLPEGGRAGVHRSLEGGPMDVSALAPGPGLAAALGRALAAVHDLPARLAEEAELPVYTAAGYRDRRMAEVDRAAATGHVPPGCSARWERALEEAGAWRFTPCVVHGDLAAENVLVTGSGTAGGSRPARLGPGPGGGPRRRPRLARRRRVRRRPRVGARGVRPHTAGGARPRPRTPGRLAGELAVARWLLHGTTTGDEAVVADAVAMLGELEAAVDGVAW